MNTFKCSCRCVWFAVIESYHGLPNAFQRDKKYKQCRKCGSIYDYYGNFVAEKLEFEEE